jgi:PleD family two-component response regulator
MVDRETGLANRKHLERSLDSMISHCENRGGGIGVCLIRVDVDETEEQRLKRIRSGTLRTISNSLQLVLRPMDQIARYDDNTFAIALIYTDPSSFDIGMFERSTRSIFRHTHHVTDQGHPFQLSMATSRWDKFDPTPDVVELLNKVEENFFELQPEPA